MTEVDEKKLWSRYKEHGDVEARDALVLHYVRIVKYIAGRMAIHIPSHIDMDDLIGWGMLGLMDAIQRYDHEQDIKFTTYASMRVRGAIIDEIRTLDWAPRSLRAMGRKIGSAKNKLRHEKGTNPTVDEIAEEMGMPTENVEEAITQLQTAQVLSLESYLPSDEKASARTLDMTVDTGVESPEQTAQDHERIEILIDGILQLPDQQQKVLNLYYYEELTLKEIGAVLDVSESRVCQIHGAAMKRLRKIVQHQGV